MTSLDDVFAVVRAYIRDNYGDHPDTLRIITAAGKKIQLPIPVAAGSLSKLHEADTETGSMEQEEEWTPFIPNGFQKGILKALEGKGLRTDALGAAVGDRARLFKPGGLQELKERGLVCHHKSLGYYRPDLPPIELDPHQN